VDPGNIATNVAAGSKYGYLLVWVLVVSNLMAMLIQYLSAKAGIATGRNLPELCRDHSPAAVSRALWVQAELIAIATDVAEVLGGALALKLLFDLPLLAGGVITALVAICLLELRRHGVRRFELTIIGFLAVILIGFLYCLLVGGVDPGGFASGMWPSLEGTESLLLAAGMLGATVMPHVIYLHGAMTQQRYVRQTPKQREALIRIQRVDVVAAMTLAGLVNLAMLVVAAQAFSGNTEPVATIDSSYKALRVESGDIAALLFALALLASGLAASGVGTLSGQVVMQGFLRRRIPILVRRLVTMVPALVVLAMGMDVTHALILSQVVLSFGIPFALIPLVLFTRRRDIMGSLVNRGITTAVAVVVAAVISALNVSLIVLTIAG
jgi:manganese transport protein